MSQAQQQVGGWCVLCDDVSVALDPAAAAFVQAAGFEPRPGRHLLLPGPDGTLAGVLFGLEGADDPGKDLFRPGALPALLPAGAYRFANSAGVFAGIVEVAVVGYAVVKLMALLRRRLLLWHPEALEPSTI